MADGPDGPTRSRLIRPHGVLGALAAALLAALVWQAEAPSMLWCIGGLFAAAAYAGLCGIVVLLCAAA